MVSFTLVSLPAPNLLPLEQREKEQKKNEIESRLKNNNYINSRNQTRPESGMNSFSKDEFFIE